MKKPHLVVLTGAGISTESGLGTFRGAGGLWEGYDIMEVASIEGWHNNPQKVLEFYNMRRAAALKAVPNVGHQTLAEMEAFFEVSIITQNVDTLHEMAGSSRVLHLHGRLDQARSSISPNLIQACPGDLNWGELHADGSQLRPHIVWFGEAVPEYENARIIAQKADLFAVIGTSLQVYPAAGLVYEAPSHIPKFLIDPEPVPVTGLEALTVIHATANAGVPEMRRLLIE
jgi:NAD-dependent deacetylase